MLIMRKKGMQLEKYEVTAKRIKIIGLDAVIDKVNQEIDRLIR